MQGLHTRWAEMQNVLLPTLGIARTAVVWLRYSWAILGANLLSKSIFVKRLLHILCLLIRFTKYLLFALEFVVRIIIIVRHFYLVYFCRGNVLGVRKAPTSPLPGFSLLGKVFHCSKPQHIHVGNGGGKTFLERCQD